MKSSALPPRTVAARSWRIFVSGTCRLAPALLAVTLIGACSDRERIAGLENLPPDVAFDPATKPLTGESGSTHAVSWTGVDPDGRIDHYRVALNPETLGPDDPAWEQSTLRSRSIVAARRTAIGAAQPVDTRAARDPFDVLAVVAVDDRGARSEPAVRVFFEDNVAPEAWIVDPAPSSIAVRDVAPETIIRFDGRDVDAANGRPTRFKYLLLGPDSEFPVAVALAHPDSLRRHYAPDFRGWKSLPGNARSVTVDRMVPGERHLFVITALDAHGAYDPLFSLNRNILHMRANASGWPRLAFGVPGAPVAESIFLEVPENEPVVVRWSGEAQQGTFLCGYRTTLDGESSAPPRPNECAGGCSRPCWDPTLMEATIGPFEGGTRHTFTVEVRDNLGRVGAQTLDILAVATSFEHDLLIVDDTRRAPDQLQPGATCVHPPIGVWPTAAELDTFLFARGGYPWRCYGPAGSLSPPGLFAGYTFDTVGTRTGATDPTVPLDLLGRYRHVVWITDARGAMFDRPANDHLEPITSLRYMSGPNRQSSLSSYSLAGGRVWLMGAGAMATTIPWNQPVNDPGGIRFSADFDELAPGRFMYDRAHWRSEIEARTVGGFITRLAQSPALLPAQIRAKSPTLDPLPPGRVGQSPSVYYPSTFAVEYLSQPNVIVENGASPLDSLYEVITFSLPSTAVRRVTMTHYHGPENGPVTFTGFEPWNFTRSDAAALVDFVLQDTWGLVRQPRTLLARKAPRSP